jgi:hypothetical protein
VIILQPVLETYSVNDFTLWPVAEQPVGNLLVLSGDMREAEVGTAMAVIAEYNCAEALQSLLDGACLFAPGGLRIRDTATGTAVNPGCCCGIEGWRGWFELLDGAEPWFGHSPTPKTEHHGDLVRLWPDEDDTAGRPVEVTRTDLAGLLQTAHDVLRGFLRLAGEWAERVEPVSAPGFTAKLDEHWRITAAR